MDGNLIRDFKGIWIPKEIWLDKRLNTIDKIILLEIDSLDASEDGCYASNKYLAEFCQCKEWSVSTSINKLIKLGYIEIIKFDGRKRFIKSRLVKITRQDCEIHKAGLGNSQEINIDNNIDNNKEDKRRKFKKPTLEEIQDYINEKGMNVNAETFYNYFTETNWVDSKGNKVKNWKQKLITWNSYGKNTKEQDVPKWFYKDLDKVEDGAEEIENILKEIGEWIYEIFRFSNS